VWFALQSLEGERIVVIHGHERQRLVVREGVARPGVYAPGLASALNAGGLWLPACRHRSKKRPRRLRNPNSVLEHSKRTDEKRMGPQGAL
jgi:hypothetical protein